MNLRQLVLATVAGSALLATPAAQADHARAGHGYHHRGHHHGHGPHRVMVRPAPVYYYAPAPVHYPPPRVYYAPPRPVIHGAIPIGDTRLRIALQF